MNRGEKTICAAVFTASVVFFVLMYLHSCRTDRNVEVLDEDFSDVNIVIAITQNSQVYRYMIKNDTNVAVSSGHRASYRSLRESRRGGINHMAFMGSITEEIEIELDAETYESIVRLAEEIIEGGERELYYSSGISYPNMLIATRDMVHEANVRPFYVLGDDSYSLRVKQLAEILREITPLEIPDLIDRTW